MEIDLSQTVKIQENDGTITLSLFALINQARTEHGMRQQDFHRYRVFCSTKVHRLRETLNKTHVAKKVDDQQSRKNAKTNKKHLSRKQKLKAQSAAVQSANSKGKGHVFVRKTIAVDEVHSDRPLQLLLFEAERAWAHSQELKQESFAKEQDSAIHRHGLSRIQRAVKWSASLNELVCALGGKRVDVMTRAEVAAYHAMLRGYESFDNDSFQPCLERLSVTRKLLYAIANASTDSRKEALANSYVDSTEAMLRYCGYNLAIDEQDMDVLAREQATSEVCEKVISGLSGLIEELEKMKEAETGGRELKKLGSVRWHNKDIPIRNPELVDVILRVSDAEEWLKQAQPGKNDEKVEDRSVDVKEGRERQRLTSAQRSAKKRSQGVSNVVRATTPGVSLRKPSLAGSKTGMDGYDNLLAALTEAEETARRLVQDNAEALAKSHSSRYEAVSTDLVNAHEYLIYKLLVVRMERNSKLIQEVHKKGERRQRRVQDFAERKTQLLYNSRPARREGSEPVRRKVKPTKKKVRPAGRTAKKPKKARNANTAASGVVMRKKVSPKKRREEERLRRQGEIKSQRISVRSVPAVTRLLELCEMSSSAISSLSLVENDASLSTLIEAKTAWYKSELLRSLARSFAWNREEAKSLLLLNRSELFIREARSAMELVEEDEVTRENNEIQPVITDALFIKSEESIQQFRRKVQKAVFLEQQKKTSAKGRSARATASKANVAINDMASKYVDFDPVDLQQAVRISPQREAELWEEVHGTKEVPDEVDEQWEEAEEGARQEHVSGGRRHQREISMATTTVSDDFDDRLVGKSNDTGGAYDPANLLPEEEDEEDVQAQKNAGWLGGWFGRKKA